MRHAAFIIAPLVLLAVVTGCKDKTPVREPDAPQLPDSAATDSTIYGRCGESTAMHTVEIITNDGDTVTCSINAGDTVYVPDVVRGGLFAGDRLAVTAYMTGDGGVKATRVINLTTLLGKWASLDRTFTIEEGGIVTGADNEPHPYTAWRILNGRLLLSADTFDIYSLGADSLWLENTEGIYEYRRMK